MQPKPFNVYRPGEAKPVITIRAYTIEAARVIAASMVAGKTIVVALDGACR